MLRSSGAWLAMACASVLALEGCAALPGVGPSKTEVIDQASETTDQGVQNHYAVIDVDQRVIDILRHRVPDSFFARFGERRSSAYPRIGVGDYVAVTIWEAGDNGLFSSTLTTDHFSTGSKSATIPEQQVGRDGRIKIPYAGLITVAGLTPQAVEASIEQKLVGKATEPQVLVTITKPISNTVTVTGEVAVGAQIPLSTKGNRILEVIAAAGGVRAPVNETAVQLSRGSRTISVPLTTVVADPRQDIYLLPGDVLTLVRDPQKFIAYGASGINQQVPFDQDRITLSEALGKIGGLNDNRADPSGIFVFRYEPHGIATALTSDPAFADAPQVPIVYRLNMRKAASLFLAQHFPVFNRDVLYVSNAPLADIQKAFELFNTVSSPAVTGVSVATTVK